MNKHPADMTEDERKYYTRGYNLLDEMRVRWGLSGRDYDMMLVGLTERLEEEKHAKLHPGMMR